jgi:hypothetical protein
LRGNREIPCLSRPGRDRVGKSKDTRR